MALLDFKFCHKGTMYCISSVHICDVLRNHNQNWHILFFGLARIFLDLKMKKLYTAIHELLGENVVWFVNIYNQVHVIRSFVWP